MSGQEISLGSVITLTDTRKATVRFIGTTRFAVGDWIGVELTDGTGKNDGAVQGERYFECEPGFGMFVRPSAIASVDQQPRRQSKQTNTATSRPSQGGISAANKKPSGLPPTTVKRQSTNATGTPTPAPRVAPRSSLRVCLDKSCPMIGMTLTICLCSHLQNHLPNSSQPTPLVRLSGRHHHVRLQLLLADRGSLLRPELQWDRLPLSQLPLELPGRLCQDQVQDCHELDLKAPPHRHLLG